MLHVNKPVHFEKHRFSIESIEENIERKVSIKEHIRTTKYIIKYKNPWKEEKKDAVSLVVFHSGMKAEHKHTAPHSTRNKTYYFCYFFFSVFFFVSQFLYIYFFKWFYFVHKKKKQLKIPINWSQENSEIRAKESKKEGKKKIVKRLKHI